MESFITQITASTAYKTIAELYDTVVSNSAGTTKRLVFSGELVAHKDNGSDLYILHKGLNIPLTPEESIFLQGIDISQIQVKGNGLILKILGAISKL